tara:strand:+ start:857 stop:2605 length:1749 start_codon:yes stop_codon:yes gene_type:complete
MALPGKNLISEKEIFDYLMTKPGMTEVKAAGIVANIAKESLYYADAVEMGDVTNPGIGLFQYTLKSRKDAFLKAVPDWKTNWKAQIDFAFEENEFKTFMKEPYETVQDSTRGFMKIFEKPKDQSEEEVQDRVNRLYNSPNIKDDLKNLPKDVPKENIEKQIQEGIQSEKEEAEKFGYKLEDWQALNDEQRNQIRKQFNLINPKPKKRDGTTNSPFLMVPDKEAEEGKFYENEKGIIYRFEDGEYKLEGEYKAPEEGPSVEGEKESVIVLDPKGQEQSIDIQKTKPVQIGELDFVDVPEEDDPDPVNTKEVLRQTNPEAFAKLYPDEVMEFVDVPEDDDLDDFSKPQTKTTETIDATQDTQEKKSLTDTLGGAASFADSAFTAASKVLDGIGGPGALVSYVLGKRALKDAMQEVQPQKRADLSPLFYEQYRQSKELAKQGFAPNEERAIRERIDDAYQLGLENAVRGTAGNRARFLAQSGVLDSARSSALLNFAAQDDQLRRQNQKEFTDLMMFKENFDQQRSEQQRAEDMRLQLQDKSAAGQFAAQAFSNVLSGLSGNNALLKRAFGNLQSGGLTPTSSIIN